MRCSDVSRRATDYAEGALGPIADWRMRRHLAGCVACSAYVTQLQMTARALPRLAAEPLTAAQEPASQEAAALALFRQWQAQPDRPVVTETRAFPSLQLAPGFAVIVLVTGLATAISLMFARHPAPMGSAWLETALLFGAACGLMLLARRRGIAAALLATLAAALPALAAHHGAIATATGVQCVMHELLTAAVPLVALALWRRTEGLSRASVVGLAAAGALAGDAALHVSCAAADSTLHLLVFHVGGVALAAALAASIAGRLLRLGTATA